MICCICFCVWKIAYKNLQDTHFIINSFSYSLFSQKTMILVLRIHPIHTIWIISFTGIWPWNKSRAKYELQISITIFMWKLSKKKTAQINFSNIYTQWFQHHSNKSLKFHLIILLTHGNLILQKPFLHFCARLNCHVEQNCLRHVVDHT